MDPRKDRLTGLELKQARKGVPDPSLSPRELAATVNATRNDVEKAQLPKQETPTTTLN